MVTQPGLGGQDREGFLKERVELPRGRGKRERSNSMFKDRYASIGYDYLTQGLFQISKHKPVTFGWVVCAIDNPTPVLASPKFIDQILSIKSCSFYIKGVKVLWKKITNMCAKKQHLTFLNADYFVLVSWKTAELAPPTSAARGESSFQGCTQPSSPFHRVPCQLELKVIFALLSQVLC